MATTKFKTAVELQAALSFSSLTANRVVYLNASKELAASSVTDVELDYLSGVTSAIQTQINAKAADNIVIKKDGSVAFTADQSLGSFKITNLANGAASGDAVNKSQLDLKADDSAVIKKNGSVSFTADQSMGSFKLTNLASPSSANDAANKQYVDSVAEGLKPKQAVRVATTADITIASDLNSGDIIDGITLANGDRVLVKDQSSASQNGIYIVGASPARSSDFDSLSPIDEINGALVAVQEGSSNAGKIYVQSGSVVTLDTSAINFVIFNSSATLVGADGITISGSNVSVDHDGNGLSFSSGQLALELDGSSLSKGASGLKLSDTAVTPASLGSATEVASFTVDQQGRLTAASNISISIPSSAVSDFNEAAQDAIGSSLTDSSSIDFTYNDGANTITAVVLTAGVDHDSLSNFVSNEHIDHSAVSVVLGGEDGLSFSNNDLTANIGLKVDINGTSSAASLANDDSVMIYDLSATSLAKTSIADIRKHSAGDILETSFSGAESAANSNITGFAFANGIVRSFKALVSVSIDATADKFEAFELMAIQKGSSWDLSVSSVGDDSLVSFSITNAGQIQYSSSTYAGFATMTMKFKAFSTSI